MKFHRFGHDYTKVLLELMENYRKLTELGVKMGFTVAVKATRDDPAERDALLKRSYELGEQREQMLLAHRDWAGPDEGLRELPQGALLEEVHDRGRVGVV